MLRFMGSRFIVLGMVCTLSAGLSACAGLVLQLKQASVQKPSNVALYFSVETKNNLPVPGLSAETFRIYEDDHLISPYESQQTILNEDVAVAHYTLLLLDLSGSITESGSLPLLLEAASAFAEKVARTHLFAVYGFDGSPNLIPVVGFTNQPAQVKSGLKVLESYRVKDPSTNLNGAVVEAVRVLEKQLIKAPQPLRFGTLVVFTDGTDHARRVEESVMYQTLDEAKMNVFAIGLGGEISPKQLARLGRVGHVNATQSAEIGAAFDEIAALIEAAGKKFYLLSYCSPARAGRHTLRVEALFQGKSGALSHEFDATGFQPNCDPNRRPNFSADRLRVGVVRVK